MSLGTNRFAFRPSHLTGQRGGAPPTPSTPSNSFFRTVRPSTIAAHANVKEEPAAVDDDGDVFQYNAAEHQTPQPFSNPGGRFRLPGAGYPSLSAPMHEDPRASLGPPANIPSRNYSPMPQSMDEDSHASDSLMPVQTSRFGLGIRHIPSHADSVREQSESARSFGTPALEETPTPAPERNISTSSGRNSDKMKTMLMETLSENENLSATQERTAADLKASREEVARLASEKTTLNKRVGDLKDANKRVATTTSTRLVELQNGLQALQMQSRESFPSAASTRDALSHLHDLRASVNEGIERIDRLFDEDGNLDCLSSARTDVSELSQELSSSRDANALLHDKLTDYASQLAAAQDRIRELEASSTLDLAALQQARENAEAADARASEERAKVGELDTLHSDALLASAHNEAELARVSERLESVIAESEKKDDTIESIRREKSELQTLLEQNASDAEHESQLGVLKQQLDAFIEASAQDRAKSASLQTALDARSSELATLTSRVAELTSALSAAQAAERKARADATRAQERETTELLTRQRLAAENAAHEKAAARLEGDLEAARTDHAAAREVAAQARERTGAMRQQLEERTEALAALRDENKELQARFDAAEKEHGAAREAAAEERERARATRQQLEERVLALAQLRDAHAELQARLAAAEKAHAAELSAEAAKHAQEKAAISAHTNGLSVTLEERVRELARLQADLTAARQTASQADARLVTAEKAHAAQLRADAAQHAQETAALSSRADGLSSALDERARELTRLLSELAAARQTAAQADARAAVAQQRFDDQAGALKLLQDARGELQERLAGAEKAHAVARERDAAARAQEGAVLRERADGLARELEERRAEIARKQDEVARRQAEIAALRGEGEQRLAAERAAGSAQLADANARLVASEQAHGRAQQAAESAKAQLAAAEHRLGDVQSGRAAIDKSLETALAEVTTLRAEIAELTAAKTRLEERRATMHTRYKSNQLDDGEKVFVDHILEECQSSSEKRLADKQNELRRRGNIVETLEEKCKQYEKTLAKSMETESGWKHKFEALQESMRAAAANTASAPKAAASAPPAPAPAAPSAPAAQSIFNIRKFAPSSSEASSPPRMDLEQVLKQDIAEAAKTDNRRDQQRLDQQRLDQQRLDQQRLFEPDPLSSPPSPGTLQLVPVTSAAAATAARNRPKPKKPSELGLMAPPQTPAAVAVPLARPQRPLKPKAPAAVASTSKATFGALDAAESDSSPPGGPLAKKAAGGKRLRSEFEDSSPPAGESAGRPKTRQRTASKKTPRTGEGKKHENAQAGPSTRKRVR